MLSAKEFSRNREESTSSSSVSHSRIQNLAGRNFHSRTDNDIQDNSVALGRQIPFCPPVQIRLSVSDMALQTTNLLCSQALPWPGACLGRRGGLVSREYVEQRKGSL